MADAVTDELVPGHAHNIADSKQKLAQLKAQAAAHLPHHDQVQRATIRVQRAADKLENIRKQLDENAKFIGQMEQLLTTMREDGATLQQRLEEAQQQYNDEREQQSNTWASTARSQLGDIQAFKLSLDTLAAKADANSEVAQLLAMGNQLVTAL
eukprot:2663677-Pyramimonas_sp.AAC.1